MPSRLERMLQQGQLVGSMIEFHGETRCSLQEQVRHLLGKRRVRVIEMLSESPILKHVPTGLHNCTPQVARILRIVGIQ